MLKWAIILLVVSLIAGALGLTPIARGARTLSMILFAAAAILFLLFLVVLVLALTAVNAVT